MKNLQSDIAEQKIPAAIWSTRLMVFDKALNGTQNIILSQGRFALAAMQQKILELYKCLNDNHNIVGGYINRHIPDILSEICFHQGVASSILFNDSSKTPRENTRAYNLRLERFNYVKSFCDAQSVSTSILSNKTVRNQLVHIDEYLSKVLNREDTGWFIDMAVDFRNQFQAPEGISVGFCRTFIASEEIILHLDSEVSVRQLWNEAVNVLAVVFGNPPLELPPSPYHVRQESLKQQKPDHC